MELALRRAAVFMVLGVLLYLASFATTADFQSLLRAFAGISWALGVVFGLIAWWVNRRRSPEDVV
jgi:hypothetical protein